MRRKKIEAAVVDSSALMCILMGEPAARLFVDELERVDRLLISAPTRMEVHLAAMGSKGPNGSALMEQLIDQLHIETVDFPAADIQACQAAALKYHIKAQPRGPLNMGDLFSFVLAQGRDLPLFFQGVDFLHTPVKNAMRMLGYSMTPENLGVPVISAH